MLKLTRCDGAAEQRKRARIPRLNPRPQCYLYRAGGLIAVLARHFYELTVPVVQEDLTGVGVDAQHADYFSVAQDVDRVPSVVRNGFEELIDLVCNNKRLFSSYSTSPSWRSNTATISGRMACTRLAQMRPHIRQMVTSALSTEPVNFRFPPRRLRLALNPCTCTQLAFLR